jgi:hypothetical protein
MPKVKGPLFSLGASGTLQRTLTFNQHQTKNIVTAPRTAPMKNTPARLYHQSRVMQMINAWNGLDAPTRDAWRTRAVSMAMTGYALFWREYIAQNIFPPDLPLIPA